MVQWILTFLVVILAAIWGIYRLMKFIRKTKKQEPPSPEECNGCSSDCTTCPMHISPEDYRINKPE